MKLLAISDHYLPADEMRPGLALLEEAGIEIEVRHWAHDSLVELQRANLLIEKGGPEAVALPEELLSSVEQFDFLVVQFAPVSRAVIASAQNLKTIAVLRSGTDNVDIAFAKELGIPVLNTPGRLARAVAECTVGLILTEIRNLARGHARLMSGRWDREFPNSNCIPELFRRTVGLIGYGPVGRLVARLLEPFGCKILAYDPYFHGDPKPAEIVSLEELLRQSDVVSLHARLTPETESLIGEKELGWMKPTAILVNTARSGLVDEQALIRVLEQGRIMGAALDVFDQEPLAADHPFLKLENVTLTPHLAGSTRDGFRNTPAIMSEHLLRLLRGETPLPIVNGVQPKIERIKWD